MTNNTTAIITDTFVNTAEYEDYLANLVGEKIDVMGGARLVARKVAKMQRWHEKLLADMEKLNLDNDEERATFDKLAGIREFVEFELKVLTDEVGGPISRWWNRMHLSGVEYGGVTDGDALDTSFLQSDEEDQGAAPVFETTEQDGEWWEEQFSKPSNLFFTDEDGEKHFAMNWDHLNKVSDIRDALAAQLLWEVDKAKTQRDLVRITKWAGLWSFHAQQRNAAKKGCVAKATTFGIDFKRYAEVCNACAHKAATLRGFSKGATAIENLVYTDETKQEVEAKAKEINTWLGHKMPGLKVFAIREYVNPVEEVESEDLLDRGAAQGEFCADTEFAIINKVSVELAMEQTIQLFDEARRHLTRPPITSFRMTEREILDWLGESAQLPISAPRLTVQLGELFSF